MNWPPEMRVSSKGANMRKLAWCAVAAYLGLVLWAAVASAGRPTGPDRAAPRPKLSEAQIRDLDIEFYRRRVERDSLSARDFTQLAGLHLQRARETADNQDLVRAEEIARHSLQLRTARNGAAFGILASSLLAQHRFSEALQAAQQLVEYDSSSISARGLLGETQLELGHYDEARRSLGSLASYRRDLSVAPRIARWEELHGRPQAARRLLRDARDVAAQQHGVRREQLAWFHLRLGDLALRNGQAREAERELRAGLRSSPDDYRLLGTMARLEAVQHQWERAIRYGEEAIAQALDPATIGLIGDAYAAVGDSAKSQEYYRAMEVTVLHQSGAFHRAWSLFLLDHGREVPAVLAKVSEEIETRRDIYGYDLLAWALHRSGRDAEARAPMMQALALGTKDAMLFYHAGMIEHALGDGPAAQRHLSLALAINPIWHPTQPGEARALLDSLAAR
jgi:tetratricopeptide (TPR) repeat protein